MHLSYLATLGSIASLSSALSLPHSVIPREADNLDEAVFLLQCTRWQKGQESPNGIKDYVWLNANADNPEPKNYYDYPYDHGLTPSGHIDWTVGTKDQPITAKLNNKKFEVWDLCKKNCNDGQSEGSAGYLPPNGRAMLDGADMRCYQSARPFRQDLTSNSWYNCTANYVCTHENRKIRRTKFDVSSATVEVVIKAAESDDTPVRTIPDEVKQQIRDAFGHLTAVDEGGVPSVDAVYGIEHSGHELQFYVDKTDQPGDVAYDPERIHNITSYLVDRLAPAIIDNGTYAGCIAGFGGSRAVCSYAFRFPRQVDVKVQTSFQWADDWTTKDRVVVTTRRQTGGKDDSCAKDGALSKALAGVFGVAAFFTSGGTSAIATGLGAVFGVVGSVECGELPSLPQ